MLGHLDQRRVVEHYVWRDVLFIGNSFTQLTQLGEQLAVVVTAVGFLHHARLQGDDARNGELQFNLATQDRSRRFGQLKRRMLGNILRGKAEVDQLADNTHPVLMALVFPDAVNRQLVVTHIADTLVVSPAQHFNDVAHPKALVHASDSRERFARVHQAIVLLRRVEADIAVAARRLTPFTKVVE